MTSFYSSRSAAAAAQAKGSLSLNVPVDALELGTDDALSLFYGSAEAEAMLFLVADITTAKQRLATTLPQSPDDGTYCAEYQFSDYAAFLEGCGTKFLAEQDYGGIIVIGLDASSWATEASAAVASHRWVGLAGARVDLAGFLGFVMSETGQTQTVYANILGFDVPPGLFASATSTSGAVDLAALQSWVSSFDESDGHWARKQVFKRYRSIDFEMCGLDGSLATNLDCGADFFGHHRAFTEHEGLERLEEALIDRLAHEQEFRWFAPHDPNTSADAIGRVASCRDILADEADACRTAMINGDFQNLCAACAFPPECDSEAVIEGLKTELEHIEELPEPDPITQPYPCDSAACGMPADHALHQNQGPFEALRDDVLCTFSGMRGLMAGGGEGAWIAPYETAAGVRKWRAEVISQRSVDDQQLTGYFHCTTVDNFWNGNGDPMNWEHGATLDAATGTATPIWSVNDYLTALSGMRGKMEGGAEQGFYDENWHEIHVDSNQGYLEAWFTGFGMNAASGGPPQSESFDGAETFGVATGTTGNASRKLPRADRAHCFLTSLEGDFDGRGESVRLSWDADTEHWELRARAGCSDTFTWDGCDQYKHVAATARCIAYDQR